MQRDPDELGLLLYEFGHLLPVGRLHVRDPTPQSAHLVVDAPQRLLVPGLGLTYGYNGVQSFFDLWGQLPECQEEPTIVTFYMLHLWHNLLHR